MLPSLAQNHVPLKFVNVKKGRENKFTIDASHSMENINPRHKRGNNLHGQESLASIPVKLKLASRSSVFAFDAIRRWTFLSDCVYVCTKAHLLQPRGVLKRSDVIGVSKEDSSTGSKVRYQTCQILPQNVHSKALLLHLRLVLQISWQLWVNEPMLCKHETQLVFVGFDLKTNFVRCFVVASRLCCICISVWF